MLIKRMKLIGICLLVLGFLVPGYSQLIITGLIDGDLSGGLPKAIEFYVLEDIPDLSIYGCGSANNGGGTDGEEFTFPEETATKGQFIYVSHEADPDEDGFISFFGFEPDYVNYASTYFNGDDAIELFRNGTVIDVFGDINTDGTGTAWEYMDGWAYRVDGTDADGSTFDLDNWEFSGINALDGETTNATAATPFPIGTYEPDVAVRLVAFYAVVQDGKTTITWETANETNCAGFYVLSSTSLHEPFHRENDVLILAQGGAGLSRMYTFEIIPSKPEHVYFQLEEITLDGLSYFYPPVLASMPGAVEATSMPDNAKLLVNYPNPFNSNTVIGYTVEKGGEVDLDIIDLRGRQMRTLHQQHNSPGIYNVHWDGTMDNGEEAPAGVYLLVLRIGEKRLTKKITLLR